MSHTVHGPAALALASLTPGQLTFLQTLPKAELHAHLNGSIPLPVLHSLALASPPADQATSATVRAGLARLQAGAALSEISDFFGLFPAIYALTATPTALGQATRGVLAHFLDAQADNGGHAQAAYVELRSIPRATAAMSRRAYMETVLEEVERYPAERAAYVVAIDRGMDVGSAEECVELAIELKRAGRRVVGVDLCGDPRVGDVGQFAEAFRRAKAAGLGLTLHIAEVADSPRAETEMLLSYAPNRVGHATFLDEAGQAQVHAAGVCVEICLSSNLLCKTVSGLDDHHIRHYLARDDAIAICTDDILPFRNSLVGEYALLMATPPLGLGLDESQIARLAQMSMDARFR